MPRQDLQSFGEDPTDVRDTDHYSQEYVGGFVEKWDDLIDWKKRTASEGSFFIDQLRARGVETVLDAAAGTGFHSVRLLEEGFTTVSVDGSPEMLSKAFQNGLDYGGHILRIVHADWRWLNRDLHGEYDAIICLGNSFTHLFTERDRRKALAEFYAMLKHDGVLILDQRNYDSILDHDFSSKHTYYYCGDEVSAEPAFVDDGLARFQYRFPDQSEYFLNMFPLRKNYMRRLLHEVGFQHIDTYGDFQETYSSDDPDFFIHVVEKSYRDEGSALGGSGSVESARSYYNSTDADNFYATIWGGEDIHVGLYQGASDSIRDASRRTVERMAEQANFTDGTKVLDIGAGFGGAARYLAKNYGCSVSCLNLSEVENERNRAMSSEQSLSHLIDVQDGDFEELPFADNSFDVVWCQDSMLHSDNRERVLAEVVRVLRPGGEFLFTDPMAHETASQESLDPILKRIHLSTMASPKFYERELYKAGMSTVSFEDHSSMLPEHYGRVLEETKQRESELRETVSQDYIDNMKSGLENWVRGGKAGDLAWGIFRAKL